LAKKLGAHTITSDPLLAFSAIFEAPSSPDSPHRHRSPHHDRSHPKRLVLQRPPLSFTTHAHRRIPHTSYTPLCQARPPPRGVPRTRPRPSYPRSSQRITTRSLRGHFRAARRRARRTSTSRVVRRIDGSQWETPRWLLIHFRRRG